MQTQITYLTRQSLDFAAIGELYLYKTLTKIKSIACSPGFPTYIQKKIEISKQPQDAARANVVARLCNSTPVRTTIVRILRTAREILGAEEPSQGKQKKSRAVDYEVSTASEKNKTEEDHNGSVFAENKAQIHESRDELEESDSSSKLHQLYSARLAQTSDDDEEDIVSIHEHRQAHPRSVSISSDASGSSSTGKPSRSRTQPRPKSTSTTFLPSLTLGGYVSGSDSNSVLSDDEVAAEQLQGQRKNRRGQQARRAIWERKFGKNAKHLREGKGKVGDLRSKGWDPKRGAVATDERNGKDKGWKRTTTERRGRGPQITGANSEAVKPRDRGGKEKKEKEKGPLHPSWEAAKKRKEQKSGVGVAFIGKKVVFD